MRKRMSKTGGVLNGREKYNKLVAVQASVDAYRDALEFVFDAKNDDVLNIAITGPYGSGKSSLANAIRDEFSDHEFMTISLTHFNESPTSSSSSKAVADGLFSTTVGSSGDDAESAKHGDTLLREIEGEILNQLVQLSDSDRIPASRFRKAEHPSWRGKLRVLLPAVLVVLGACVGLDLTLLTQCAEPFDVVFRTAGWGTVLANLLYVAWHWLDRGGVSGQIRRIGFKGSEIEVFDQAADSIFDKYIDDIIYIFDNCGKDVVVFEDLDRFCDQRVFEKLREINRLVNERRHEAQAQADKRAEGHCGIRTRGVERARPLRFFYLVRDDLFLPNERTKFFDFVIPVLPYVDRRNAAAKLETTLGESGVMLKRAIIEDVSLFIDDARIMYNIGNEFLMLRNRVGEVAARGKSSTDLDWGGAEDEKLFALVVYKNVFPHDFVLLQNRRGYLHALLDKREELVKAILSDVETQRRVLQDRLEKAKEETARDIAGLQLEFLAPTLVQYSVSYGTYRTVAQKWLRSDEYDPRAFIDDLLEVEAQNGPIREALKRFDTISEYTSRKQAIDDKAEKARAGLLAELAELSDKSKSARALNLATLFLEVEETGLDPFVLEPVAIDGRDDGGIDEVHVRSMTSDMHFDLVRVLVANGYIDESYERYMSVFQPGILSENDDMFLKRVAARRIPSPDYELEEPGLVLDRIEPFRFAQASVRNHGLVEALVKSGDTEKISLFIDSLKRENEVGYVAAFVLSAHYAPEFFEAVSDFWPAMPEKAFSSARLSDDTLHHLSQFLVADGAMNSNRWDECPSFYKFINSDEDFLVAEDELAERMRNAIPLLDRLALRRFEAPETNSSLRHAVYESGRYAANVEAVCSMLKLECEETSACASNMLLLAGKHVGEPLGSFVEGHLSSIIQDWLDASVADIDIDEGTACWVFNVGKMDTEEADRFSSKLPYGMLTNLSSVSDRRYWPGIVNADAVEAESSNMLAYIAGTGGEFDDTISAFVNRHNLNVLADGALDGYYDDPFDFCSAVMRATEIQPACAAGLLESADIAIEDLDGCPASSELMLELVERRMVRVDANSVGHMREDYSECFVRFTELNIEAILELLAEGSVTLSASEITKLLERRQIPEKAQAKLIKASGYLFKVNPDYSDGTNIAILNGPYDADLLSALPGLYETASVNLKTAIDAFYCRLVETSGVLGDELPFGACLAIMRSDKLEKPQKRFVLARYVGNYDREEVVSLLEALGESLLATIVKADLQQAKVELEPGIRDLVTAMQRAHHCGGDSPIGVGAIMLHSLKWK